MHSIGIRLGTLCDAAQAEEQEMKRLKTLFSRDADATASLWRKEHGSRQPGGQQSSCATRDPDPCPQIVRLCESIRAADGTEVTESAGITTVFREHYKQLGSPLVCAEFDADNFDRVTAKVQDWVASQSTKRMQSTTNFHQEGDGTRSRGPADIQSWRRC
jgi:hypothetical protein